MRARCVCLSYFVFAAAHCQFLVSFPAVGHALTRCSPHSTHPLALCTMCVGKMRAGVRHGHGMCIYADGRLYEGYWRLGLEHGYGVLSCWVPSAALMAASPSVADKVARADGAEVVLYEGSFADGRFHGHGTYKHLNGDVYCGEWREGSMHGASGRYDWAYHQCYYDG